MEYINFEDFAGQAEKNGIHGFCNIVIEWLNYQNMTYDLFKELVDRYSRMDAGQKELYTLPFAPKDM